MKGIFEDHGTLRAKLVFYYDVFIFVYGLKVFLYIVCQSERIYSPLFEVDPLAHLINDFLRENKRSSLLVVTTLLFLFASFVLVLSHSFYSLPVDKPIWRWYHSLIVGIQDLKQQHKIKNASFQEEITDRSQSTLISVNNGFSFYAKMAARFHIWREQDLVDKEKLYISSPILAEASERLRIRLLLGLQLVDQYCFITHLLIGLIYCDYFLMC